MAATAAASSRQRQRRRDSVVVPVAAGGEAATRTRTRSKSDRHHHERERPAPIASIELPSAPSPRILFPAIPKNLTSTTGESVTRAGLLVRTSDDPRASGESARRHRRESHVGGGSGSTGSPLLQEIPASVSASAGSGSGRGGERSSRRPHRSGGDGKRERAAEQPVSTSRDGGEDARPVRRDDGSSGGKVEESGERPHKSSRRESGRRERRPTVVEKEKKSSFFGSIFKAAFK